MTHGSLFSGIGGFDLAAEWMGWENLFHCEWNTFGQKVLHHYWPNAEQFTDITKTDFTKYANKIDVLTGGFPCQPYSLAGKRKGKDDERHLWPEMLRAIREIQPRWVVGENVFGLINWNAGMVFHEVQTDLEAAGYEVWPYVLPACAVNAPHRRDRVWFVARNTEGNGKSQVTSFWEEQSSDSIRVDSKPGDDGEVQNATDPEPKGLQGAFHNTQSPDGVQSELTKHDSKMQNGNATNAECIRPPREEYWIEKPGQYAETNKGSGWQNFPTESPICSGNDGLPDRLDGITFSKWRNESIKAYGNAIVPQVALQIFKAIEQFELQSIS